MEPDSPVSRPSINAETVLTAALKLVGVYLLFSAILQSGMLMSTLYSIAMQASNPGMIGGQEWATFGSTVLSTGLAVFLAVVLIRHGGRAAHWLAIQSDLQVPALTPTRSWFRGAIALIGVWILATQLFSTVTAAVWLIVAAFDSNPAQVGFPYTKSYALVSAFHAVALLIFGIGLIYGARPIGDWLYRISGAADADTPAQESL